MTVAPRWEKQVVWPHESVVRSLSSPALFRVCAEQANSAIMQAIFNGMVLAESDDIVKVDGNPYFPREAMNTEFFRESSHSTVCGWKGTARYWDVVVGDQVITNAVWAYDTPKPEAESIRERFAFYRNKGVTLA